MLSLATGHDIGYFQKAVEAGRESYYSGAVDAGEPPGLWVGAGAERLGLDGTIDADMLEAVYTHLFDPRDPATHSRATWGDASLLATPHRKYRSTEEIYEGLVEANPDAGPEELAELHAQAERSTRNAVAFIDATFSAPKSVTVLAVAFERAASDAAKAGDHEAAAAWTAHAKAVEDAVMAGARASLEYLQSEAGYARVGHHGGGAGRWIDAGEFVAAQFLQHDSRDHDPQLHVHQPILNRQLCADGEWRTLDSRAIHMMRGAAGAMGERVMEANLARSLGVWFETRPDGKAREIVGISQAAMDLFSSRRRAVSARTQELVDAYREQCGREPNALERTRLAIQATLSTRSTKQFDGETREEQLDRWATQLQDEVGTSLGAVAHGVLAGGQEARAAVTWSARDVMDRALARVGERSASFTRADLVRAISDELPGHLGVAPDQVRPLLEGLANEALLDAVRHTPETDTSEWPEELRLANGRSVFEGPGTERYSTDGQFHAERQLREAAIERGAASVTEEQAVAIVEGYAAAGRPLGVDQAAAVRGVLASGARVEVLSAAPGTGKSFVVGAISEAWTDTASEGERRVFGLAPSQIAARVLAEEGVGASMNTTAWLGAQRRGDEEWRLRQGDLVVVDEANMAGTDQLAEIQQRCAAADAKLLLVGDPRQLAAVGPGGALADVAEHGLRYELAEVRRFTAEWERTASLRLRDGDPAALDEYAKHGRLRDGGTVEQAEAGASRAWLADTLDGRESLLMVRDNHTAARVSAALRAELVDLGKVDEAGVPLGMDGWEGVTAGVGDLVQARRNAWHLDGYEGNERAPINRDTFRVVAVRPDGGLTVAPIVGRADAETEDVSAFGEELGPPLQLPRRYVADHVTLAYASTAHAAEGRTVDTSHSVFGTGTDAAGLLVPMTRGRDGNTAWVVTTAMPADTATGQTLSTPARSPRAVLADVMENDRAERSALAELEAAQLAARSTLTHVDRLIDLAAQITVTRTADTLDRLAAQGDITLAERRELAVDEATTSLERLLRTAELAGHDPDKVLTAAATARNLDGASSPARVLHRRITSALEGRLTPHVESTADLIPRGLDADSRLRFLHERVSDAETRRHELGAQTAEDAPQWALDALGPVPDDTDLTGRLEWERRAGWAASWRELAGHQDDVDPLGAAPSRGLVEKSALFRKAHEELNLLDVGAEEADLTDGRLRARVAAYEREKTWAPESVADDLAAAREAADRAHVDSTVWSARADATADPHEREQLREAAQGAARKAEELDVQARQLAETDDARTQWYLHTLVTRENAHRAGAELRARGIDVEDRSDHVTAAEWLDAHRAEQDEADLDREITETDLADDDAPVAQPARAGRGPRIEVVNETAESVARAQEALRVLTERQALDDDHAVAEPDDAQRSAELNRWAQEDEAATTADDDGSALQR